MSSFPNRQSIRSQTLSRQSDNRPRRKLTPKLLADSSVKKQTCQQAIDPRSDTEKSKGDWTPKLTPNVQPLSWLFNADSRVFLYFALIGRSFSKTFHECNETGDRQKTQMWKDLNRFLFFTIPNYPHITHQLCLKLFFPLTASPFLLNMWARISIKCFGNSKNTNYLQCKRISIQLITQTQKDWTYFCCLYVDSYVLEPEYPHSYVPSLSFIPNFVFFLCCLFSFASTCASYYTSKDEHINGIVW